MSTAQSRTAALELAVDLACAQAECLGVDVSTETVLARAEKFDAYIVCTGTPSLLAQAAGAVPLTYCAFDEVPAGTFAQQRAEAETAMQDAHTSQTKQRRVTPADLYARGRMSR